MEALFSLIHSLSPSEKRYFTLFAQRQVLGKNTNYIKLFNAINQQIQYDEKDLLKKFRKEIFIKQFGVTKNYLFQMILKSMELYNEEHFLEWRIRNMLLQIKILASKGLDKEAEKLIAKTKELAWQYEFYNLILDVITIEKYMFGNFRMYEAKLEVFQLIADEEAKAAQISLLHQQIVNVWHYLTLLELKIGAISSEQLCKEATMYMQHSSMQCEPEVSYNTRFRYWATQSLYYNLIDNQKENHNACKQCILIREEQIQLQQGLNLDPLASYYNFMVACEKAGIWEDFELYLTKTFEYPAHTKEVQIRKMHNYSWCGLMYYLQQKKYGEAALVMQRYIDFFVTPKVQFRKDFRIYIEASCGLVCFFKGAYKQAMQWWQPILNEFNAAIELRTQGAVHLYTIMMHIEEENYDILEYVIARAKKLLAEIGLLHLPEQLFLKYASRCNASLSRKERMHLLTELYNQTVQLPLSISGNAFNVYILHWLEQKVG